MRGDFVSQIRVGMCETLDPASDGLTGGSLKTCPLQLVFVYFNLCVVECVACDVHDLGLQYWATLQM